VNRFFRLLIALIAVVLAGAALMWNSRRGQDWLLERATSAAIQRQAAVSEFDGLKVLLCGTSSPLPDPNRAQACVAVFAGGSLYLVDAGAGSARTAALAGLPLQRLAAVLLTHFHSDHIAALPDFNLNSWVAGRPKPLTVFGPVGVAEVVDGLNQAYRLDRGYRVLHHGADLLPPELGIMESRTIDVEEVLKHIYLTITSFQVSHDPVRPAVGYRFDYRGRSVVISGDAIVTPSLIEAARGADLLLQDALSLTIVQALERAAAGSRLENIFHDIQDYHAATSDLGALVESTGVGRLALYHLVPPPQNALLEKIFSRDLPRDTILTRDEMVFELPAGSERVTVIAP
jgi:ribonuclease Z